MKFTKEIIEGVPSVRIHDDTLHYTFGYYSNNSWVDENRIVLLRTEDTTVSGSSELVLINLEDGTEKPIFDGLKSFVDCVVHGENIYCVSDNTLYATDINGKEPEVLYKGGVVSFPHMTADGRYINWSNPNNEKCTYECYRIDLQTKEVVLQFEKHFAKPFPVANHMNISPTDPDKVFFAHEGDTFYISNRLWLYEKDKGMRCIAKQNLDADGNLGDCFGHECWSHDGKGLYFVKYPCSPVPPRGLSYVDLEGNQRNAIYGKYPYWHVCCSPDGKFLAADTQSGAFSGVCLINLQTGEEKMIAKAGYDWKHPNHPHPCFSPKTTKLCYNELYNGKTTVVIVDMKDII